MPMFGRCQHMTLKEGCQHMSPQVGCGRARVLCQGCGCLHVFKTAPGPALVQSALSQRPGPGAYAGTARTTQPGKAGSSPSAHRLHQLPRCASAQHSTFTPITATGLRVAGAGGGDKGIDLQRLCWRGGCLTQGAGSVAAANACAAALAAWSSCLGCSRRELDSCNVLH